MVSNLSTINLSMPEGCSELTPPPLVAFFMEQLTALGVEPGDQDLAAKSLAALKIKLAEGKTACEKAQIEVETLTRAVKELKKTAHRLAEQVLFWKKR
jgi:hypothetical protein